MKQIISFLLVLMVSILSQPYGNTAPATPTPIPFPSGHNGMVSPDYKPNQKILSLKMESLALEIHEEGLLQSEREYFIRHNRSSIPKGSLPPSLFKESNKVYPQTFRHWRVLSLEREWKQPNDYAHRNYCGPASTQAALDVRLPSAVIPDIDTIGAMENIDPDWGVTMNSIVITLNQILSQHGDIPNNNGFVAYEIAQPGSWVQLFNFVHWDIVRGYATVVGVYTEDMPDWVVDAYHIVTAVGMYHDSYGYYAVKYADPGSWIAGYRGEYMQWVDIWTFWEWHAQNNVIAW